MAKFVGVTPMDFTNPNGWADWSVRFDRYRIATKLHKDNKEVQVNALIYSMGPEAEYIYFDHSLFYINFRTILHQERTLCMKDVRLIALNKNLVWNYLFVLCMNNRKM